MKEIRVMLLLSPLITAMEATLFTRKHSQERLNITFLSSRQNQNSSSESPDLLCSGCLAGPQEAGAVRAATMGCETRQRSGGISSGKRCFSRKTGRSESNGQPETDFHVLIRSTTTQIPCHGVSLEGSWGSGSGKH